MPDSLNRDDAGIDWDDVAEVNKVAGESDKGIGVREALESTT